MKNTFKRLFSWMMVLAMLLSLLPMAVLAEGNALPTKADGYIKVTSADQFTSGDYVMIVSTGYAPGAIDGTWLTAVQPVVSGNVVTDTKGGVWTLTVSGSSVIIKDANGTAIGPKGGNSNGLTTGTDYSWDWSFENGTFVFKGVGEDTVALASNATTTGNYPGNHRFRGYKTTTIESQPENYPANFTLYKLNGEYVEPSEPAEPTDPQVTEPAVSSSATLVTAPEAGVAYKMGLDKGNGPLFFTGNTESETVTYRLETSDNAANAADVYLEAADGGYRLYFMNDGVKTYIRVYHRTDGDPGYGKGSLEYVTSAPSEVFAYDETVNTLIYDYDGNNAYYMGTYGSYVTISVSNTSYITGDNAGNVDVSQYPVRFYTVEEGGEEPSEPSEPTTPSEPEQPSEPAVSGNATLVTAPEAGVAYKMGLDKGDGKILFFTGNTESETVTYRLETSDNAANAADVYLEAADGGYRLYFMNDGVKTYIRVYHRTDGDPGYGKGSLEYVTSAPSEVFAYDETVNTLIYDYDGNNAYYMGTYGSYVTISVSNTSYITGDNAGNVDVSQFPARFYTVEEGGEEPSEPSEPTTPSEPEQPSEPTEPELPEDYEIIPVVIVTDDLTIALTSLSEDSPYGYMPGTELDFENETLGLTEANIFYLVLVDEETCMILDAYGRYVYMAGTYNSVNVSTEMPETGHLWTVTIVDEEMGSVYLTNAATGKVLGYSADYGSFGVYPDEARWTPVLILSMGAADVIPGDLNSDGVVDNLDVEYLLWYTLFPDDYPLNQDPDFNGDGVVDNLDVEYLLWYTLFPEDNPLPEAV